MTPNTEYGLKRVQIHWLMHLGLLSWGWWGCSDLWSSCFTLTIWLGIQKFPLHLAAITMTIYTHSTLPTLSSLLLHCPLLWMVFNLKCFHCTCFLHLFHLPLIRTHIVFYIYWFLFLSSPVRTSVVISLKIAVSSANMNNKSLKYELRND